METQVPPSQNGESIAGRRGTPLEREALAWEPGNQLQGAYLLGATVQTTLEETESERRGAEVGEREAGWHRGYGGPTPLPCPQECPVTPGDDEEQPGGYQGQHGSGCRTVKQWYSVCLSEMTVMLYKKKHVWSLSTFPTQSSSTFGIS